ncbi:FAD-binding oxidoreductase [Amycolatopsis ultiminotia]|uniref:FAD-binding oxidoreductase n=1 Tax=Amycolatopsis ultiminotia TaxID=543629 RepID=A0ABP6YLV7_9PSEU
MTDALRRTLEKVCPGRVVVPEHAWYDRVRLLFNGMYDKRPSLICLPRDTAEVRSVIKYARDAELPTAVRGGGHNIGGAGSIDGGLVIDLRLLDGVEVRPDEQRAFVGGGATWATFDDANAAHGLATTGGTFDTTGVGGLTLGGGIGHLMGRYGLACDNVRSYELVTANGDELVVEPGTQPELDWALRGAGHLFGVVTRFDFQLHPVSRVYGGFVGYSGEQAGRVVRLFRELMTTAPDELTCTLLLERHGVAQKPAAVLSVAYCGSDEAFIERLNKKLREIEVLEWQLRTRTYPSMQAVLGRLPFGLRHYWSARCVDGLPDELVDRLVARFAEARLTDPFNDTILIEPIHGAVRRVPAAQSVVPFREARFNVTGMAIWAPAEADDQQTAWARSVSAETEPYSRWGEGYLNYVSDQSGDATARAVRTFGTETFDRLRAIKRTVDPDGFFQTSYGDRR